MSDKRSVERTRSFLKGQIVFNNRMTTMDCIVRNLSATGAKLALTETLALPDQFDLVIPQKGETLRARLKWRRDDEIGIVFASAADESKLALRVRELEAEVAHLRRLLASAQAASEEGAARAVG